jgi:hypothetical protein
MQRRNASWTEKPFTSPAPGRFLDFILQFPYDLFPRRSDLHPENLCYQAWYQRFQLLD